MTTSKIEHLIAELIKAANDCGVAQLNAHHTRGDGAAADYWEAIQLRRAVCAALTSVVNSEISAARSQNERLRAALTDISRLPQALLVERAETLLERAADISRRALNEAKDDQRG